MSAKTRMKVCRPAVLLKLLCCIICISGTLTLAAQKTFYGETPIAWENYRAEKPAVLKEQEELSDLLILSDQAEFCFYAQNNEKLTRNLIVKINTQKGLDIVKTHRLPESFDPAFDAHYFKQGRMARVKTPFITEFTLKKYGARKIYGGKWKELVFDLKYEEVKWMKTAGDFAGEFVKEDIKAFHLRDLQIGDVVQIAYEADFNASYGNNLFYLTSAYPKLSCEYTFTYKVGARFSGYGFVLPVNIPDSCVKRTGERFKDYEIISDKITLTNLGGINYPSNSFEGNRLPHVFADFRVFRILTGSYPSDGGRIYDFEYYRPKNFGWMVSGDTTNYYTKVYDKQFAAIRKFSSRLPPYTGNDSTNTGFFKALCDTLNSFRYITSNHMFYNEPNLRDVYSGEHLLKRRLVEHLQWKTYKDILNDSKVFYSVANIQDKRYGEHNSSYRAAYAYEKELIAIPSGNSYIYFMPRYRGMKYHLNELPFYLEGTLALLQPRNFQADVKNKEDHIFRFIKTHRGTFNENTRTENAVVRISLDSLKADLLIKESLSGQFSTVLRHLYLGDAIDSTISTHYFRKCTDKPFASKQKIKLSSKMTEFPFRYNFNCTEQIGLAGDKHLRLKNWFSFPLSKNTLPEQPQHDYYFDFEFSDAYNFLLNFSQPVELKNASAFSKKLSNELFELESEIVAQSENAYLLKVKLVIRKARIKVGETALLMNLVNELEALNDFSLELAGK